MENYQSTGLLRILLHAKTKITHYSDSYIEQKKKKKKKVSVEDKRAWISEIDAIDKLERKNNLTEVNSTHRTTLKVNLNMKIHKYNSRHNDAKALAH